jgi:hypothetical protein
MVQIDKKHIGHEFKAYTAVAEHGKLKLFCQGHRRGRPDLPERGSRQEAGYPKVPVTPTIPAGADPNDDPARVACCACSTSISA